MNVGPEYYSEDAELKVWGITVLDEMEGIIRKDLVELGCEGTGFRAKLLERKAALDQAF